MKDITSTGIILVFVKYQCQFLFNDNESRIVGFTVKMQIQRYINCKEWSKFERNSLGIINIIISNLLQWIMVLKVIYLI